MKSPTPASIGRKRAVRTNYPPTGKKRCQGATASDPKKITPAQRACEFKDESLIVSQNKLFCNACHESIGLKIIRNHIQSAKHCKSKEKVKSKELRNKNIVQCLQKYSDEVHITGETLPEAQQIFRVKVVTAFLKAGIPLNKLVHFKDLLEENNY